MNMFIGHGKAGDTNLFFHINSLIIFFSVHEKILLNTITYIETTVYNITKNSMRLLIILCNYNIEIAISQCFCRLIL